MIKQIAILLITALVSAGLGYWSHNPATITKTEIQIVEKIVEKQSTSQSSLTDHSLLTQTITQKDGTIIQSVLQKDISDQKSEKKSEISKEIQIVEKQIITVSKSKYSLGLQAEAELKQPLTLSYRAEGGVRVLDSIWIESSYNWTKNSFGLGIRIEK
jgi:hypothetical protein